MNGICTICGRGLETAEQAQAARCRIHLDEPANGRSVYVAPPRTGRKPKVVISLREAAERDQQARREEIERQRALADERLREAAPLALLARAALDAFVRALPAERIGWEPPLGFGDLTLGVTRTGYDLAAFAAWAEKQTAPLAPPQEAATPQQES